MFDTKNSWCVCAENADCVLLLQVAQLSQTQRDRARRVCQFWPKVEDDLAVFLLWPLQIVYNVNVKCK